MNAMDTITIAAVVALAGLLLAVQIRLILTKQKMKLQNDDNHTRIEAANQMYQDVYQQNVQMRYWKHDLKELMVNHPEYQSCEKIEELLHTIFEAKAERAEKTGVAMTVDQEDSYPDLEEVFGKWNREDIVRLMTNIINNAIEAAEKCENGRVHIKLNEDAGKLCITVQNSMRNGSSPLKNGFRTDKTDGGEHGLGSKIIREIVEKYQDILEITEENHEFILKVYVSG